MEKKIEHSNIPPKIEKKISANDLIKYHTESDSLPIIFGQVESVYADKDGQYSSPDFLEKYQDYSIWKTKNRLGALTQKYEKYNLEELEKEQKYILQLDTVIRSMAKGKWQEKDVNGKKKKYFKNLKTKIVEGKLEGVDVTDTKISGIFYASSQILDNVIKPTIILLSKLIREKEQEKIKDKLDEKTKEDDKEKAKPVEKLEEIKPEEQPKIEIPTEEKEKTEDLSEKLKLLENTVKEFKDNESAILEKRYGKGILGKFHRWLETTHIGKATKITAKILGGIAAAGIATTTTGGVGLVLAPILYAGGARYAISGAIEGLQYLIGGWKRNHLLGMQSASMNSLITQKDYIFNLDDKDKNKYADHIKEVTARIKEQETNVLNTWLSNIAKERRDKLVRAVLATVATGAFAWMTGLPFGWQDFDKNGLYHSVVARHDGFSFLYRGADNLSHIRGSLNLRDMGFWGIGHTLGHGLPTLGYVGLGTAAAGIAIKLARDIKQGYRDIFAPGYKSSEVKPVDFSKPIVNTNKAEVMIDSKVEAKEDEEKIEASKSEENKTEEVDRTNNGKEIKLEEKEIKITPETYASIYPELEEFVVKANEKLNNKSNNLREKKEALEKIVSNLEINVKKKIKEFEGKFQDNANFDQNKEDFVDYKKDLYRAFSCFAELDFEAFVNNIKENFPLASSFFEMGAKRFAEHVKQPK